jgi:hypothetical protein
MNTALKEALLWAVVFVVIAVVIAAGIRIVAWVTEGTDDTQVWKAALLLLGASGAGGKAIQSIRKSE